MGDPVAVLGAGVCTPAGSSLDKFWDGQVAAQSTSTVKSFDLLPEIDLPVCVTTDVPHLAELSPHELRRLDRPHLLAISAADSAVASVPPLDPNLRWGLVVGTGYGAGEWSQTQASALRAGGFRAISPMTIPLTMPSSVTAHLGIRFGIAEQSITIATACAAGANAIGEAMWLLRTGRADVVLAGGVESLLYATPLAGFARLSALSTHTGPTPMRPFDVDRDGFVMGEGAAFVVLALSTTARRLSLTSVGELLGYATNNDASHVVRPLADGSAAARCMQRAIEDAGVTPADIGHINAHGTSTPLNDIAEARAINAVFRRKDVPVTATKGVTGHMIGASGAAEVVAALQACARGIVPPVAGLSTVDPAIVLDVVQGSPRRVQLKTAISNSFAFGGTNSSIVVAA